MLKDLRKYSNLGTPLFYYELVNYIGNSSNQKWTINDLKSFYHNKIIDGRYIFDGCIEFAIKIKLFTLINGFVVLDKLLTQDTIVNYNKVTEVLIRKLFKKLKEDKDIDNIFSLDKLKYDVSSNSIKISNSVFGLKYSNFKQLLLDFNIIHNHPSGLVGQYLINSHYRQIFEKELLKEIKKRRISIKELQDKLNRQKIQGENAEKFVLEFEKMRLNAKDVKWIAEFIVNEGYDIASYDNADDKVINRYIEVKSYEGEIPYFYWSKNEFETAKHKGDKYWIYLVNRFEMNNPGYIPGMIQNPYKLIIDNNKYVKEVENYKINLIGDLDFPKV